MTELIRTSISISKKLFDKIRYYNINVSKICQSALEKEIKTEGKNEEKLHMFNKLKKIYYQKGFETGCTESKNISAHELKISQSIMKGEGRYSVWNIVDRVDDVFEKNFNYKIFDNHFYKYNYGWVLKDNAISNNVKYSWFTTEKQIDETIQDFRAETFFEYKHGFSIGFCGFKDSIDSIENNIVASNNKFNNEKLSKKQSIKIIEEELNLKLNNHNTIFSNQNNANDLWWFEPTYKKLESQFYLILNDKKERTLFLFNISEKGKLTKKLFRDRQEKGRVSITINSKDTSSFMDINSGSSNVKFAKYLIKTIKY